MRSLPAVLLALAIAPVHAQQSAIKAPAIPDTPARSTPGLTLTFTCAGKSDTRRARLVALYVPTAEPATPFLPAGAFTAKWEGEITSPIRTEYTFAADVKGSFKLIVNGTLLLEGAGDTTAQTVNKEVQLKKGANKIVAEFASDNQSDALLRLGWWSKEFPFEPVPPMAFIHAASKQERAGQLARDGRLLFAQFRCAACHDATGILPPRGEGMPELAHDAPVFDEPGAKYNESFLAHWINDPHSIRPGSLMPRVFSGNEGKVDARAADLAAYFASLGKRDDTAPAVENAPLGGGLFANFGCLGCHTTPDFKGKDEYGRIPLSHLKAKWQPHALRAYLQNPSKNYAWARMPNFRLTDEEAERITAYLLAGQQREFPEVAKGDAGKGAQLLVSAGCLNCHAGLPPTTTPKLTDTLKSGWTKGCLASDAAKRGKAPDFRLTPEQRDSLLTFASSGFDALKKDAPAEFAERQIRNLRCTACHGRDGELSTWSQLENEIALLQAAAPPPDAAVEGQPFATTAAPALTWIGEKLRTEWATKFVAGQTESKPRPWLLARMPGFVTYAEGLAKGLAFDHGFPLTEPPEPVPEDDKAKVGEILIGENGGFNCTTCHGVGERAPTAVFEAPGINLLYSVERLRKGHFLRWVFDPLRIDPETKMPRFADEEGKTPLSEHYGGNAREQFEAIWQYLRSMKK